MSQWYRDHYEWVLTLMWEDLLGVERISVRDNFRELGGTSAQHKNMLQMVQRLWSVSPTHIPTQNIEALAFDVRTRRHTHGLKQKPLVIPGSGTGSIPLVYIHGVAGEPMFDPKLLRFDMGRPIVCLRSIGMDLEEAPLDTVDAMVERYVADLIEVVDEPYVLAGASTSAVIAFAMAQRLEEHGKEVAFAGLLEPPLLGKYPKQLQDAMAHRLQELCLVGEVEYRPHQVEACVQDLKDAGAIPPSYSTKRVLRHTEVYARNARAAYEHVPHGRLNGHTVLYESRAFGCGPEPLGSLEGPRDAMHPYERFWAKYLAPQTLIRRQNCEHRSIDGTLLTRTWLREDINAALHAHPHVSQGSTRTE